MRCTIWCYSHNFKNAKNTHGGVLLFVKLQGCFSRFLNCINGTKSRKLSHIQKNKKIYL